MEWVIIGIVVIAAVAWFAMGSVINAAKRQQETDPDRFLDQWFDGSEQVIVRHSSGTLSKEAILAGGNARGYRLVTSNAMPYPNTGQTEMIFERRDDGSAGGGP